MLVLLQQIKEVIAHSCTSFHFADLVWVIPHQKNP